MIIKSVALHNFGLYAGDHIIDLSMTSKEQPIILVGGLNGRGKTTLLEAVLLALYGRQSFAFSTSKLPYGTYLLKYISNAPNCHEAYVELQLQVKDDQPILTIRRSWSDDESPVSDHFSVCREKEYDPYLSENWASFMETILPSGISKFFFFDGEKITELADDHTDSGLKSAIKSLLGIDTIDRLISDLNRIISRKDVGDTHSEKSKDLEILVSSTREAHAERTQAQGELDALKRRIAELREEEEQYKREIISHSGNLVQNYDRYTEDRTELRSQLGVVEHEMAELTAGALPLAMVAPLLSHLQSDALEARHLQEKHLVAQEMQSVRDHLKQALDGKVSFSDLSQIIQETFSKYDFSSESSVPRLGVIPSDRALFQLNQLNTGAVLSQELMHAKILAERRISIEDQVDTLTQYIQRAENEMEVHTIYEKVDQCTKSRVQCEDLKMKCEKVITELNGKIFQNEKQIRILKQHLLEAEHGRIQEARTIRYANMSIQVMEIFRERLQRTKVQRLLDLINERFQLLAEKQDLVGEIKIDPVTLDISLHDVSGTVFSTSKLSAGERQMLVIALLWGLTASLENPLPVMIDTPLARLDSKHRENFVKKYLPKAGQQVIVLSTDEEISGTYQKMLSSNIAAEYLLEYDSAQNRTNVKKGYFKR